MKQLIAILFSICLTTNIAAQELQEKQDSTTTKTATSKQHQVVMPAEKHMLDAWGKAAEAVAASDWRLNTTATTAEKRPQALQLQSVEDRRDAMLREKRLNKQRQQMKVTIGNTSSGNWSPFPDRMLDARTISMPLPRK